MSHIVRWTHILAARHEWKHTHRSLSKLPQKEKGTDEESGRGSGELSCQMAGTARAQLPWGDKWNSHAVHSGSLPSHSDLEERCCVCACVCVCWLSLTSGIQLSSWFGFDPTFSAFVLFLPSFVHCSFHLNPIIIFSLLFLLPVYSCAFFSSFRLSFSTHVPVAPSSVWRCGRKLSRIASELWTTDFNFRCL